MKKNIRDPFVDILKGIGILSVVIGHSGTLLPGMVNIPVTAFVYLYHLMVFFFTAGMVYNPEKYQDPYFYIGRQLKSSGPLYILYTWGFLLLHNLFAAMHLVDIPAYTRNDLIIYSISTSAFIHTELIAGALWFVPTLLFSKAFFAVGFQWAQKRKYPRLAHLAVICITGAIGLYTNHYGFNLSYHLQTAVLGVPVIYLGYLFALYRTKIQVFARPILAVPCAAFMYWFLKQNVGFIELSQNKIISPYLFYPMTVCGMLFCVCLASAIQKWKYSSNFFSYIGTISFHIMALHFLVFKCFDWICGRLMGLDQAAVMRFPGAFDNIGAVYTFLGVIVPTLLVYGTQTLRQKRYRGNKPLYPKL